MEHIIGEYERKLGVEAETDARAPKEMSRSEG